MTDWQKKNRHNIHIHPANRGPMSIAEYMSAEDTFEALRSPSGYGRAVPVPDTPLRRKEDRFRGLCRTIASWKRAFDRFGPHEIRDKWTAKYHYELDQLETDLVALAPTQYTLQSVAEMRKVAGACR